MHADSLISYAADVMLRRTTKLCLLESCSDTSSTRASFVERGSQCKSNVAIKITRTFRGAFSFFNQRFVFDDLLDCVQKQRVAYVCQSVCNGRRDV
jgi:hypothetical protein